MAESAKSSCPELDDWVLAVLPRALAYAGSLLRDRGAAEDVVHDCFCALLRKADVYDLPRDGTRLLFKAITNACLKRNSRERAFLSLGPGDEDDFAIEVADQRVAAPVEVVLGRELEQHIAAGLEQLPLAQRAALELKGLGHSLQEIAEALEVSTSNAGVLVHRARAALARHLAPYLQEKAS